MRDNRKIIATLAAGFTDQAGEALDRAALLERQAADFRETPDPGPALQAAIRAKIEAAQDCRRKAELCLEQAGALLEAHDALAFTAISSAKFYAFQRSLRQAQAERAKATEIPAA